MLSHANKIQPGGWPYPWLVDTSRAQCLFMYLSFSFLNIVAMSDHSHHVLLIYERTYLCVYIFCHSPGPCSQVCTYTYVTIFSSLHGTLGVYIAMYSHCQGKAGDVQYTMVLEQLL